MEQTRSGVPFTLPASFSDQPYRAPISQSNVWSPKFSREFAAIEDFGLALKNTSLIFRST